MKVKKTTEQLRADVDAALRYVEQARREFFIAIRSSNGVQYVREKERNVETAMAVHKRAETALKRRLRGDEKTTRKASG